MEQDDNTPKVIYHAIKFGHKYLGKIGSSLTHDLGQARLYVKTETWEENKKLILSKMSQEDKNTNYKVVTVELKEI